MDIDSILESMKKRRVGERETKRESLAVKVTLAWMNYSHKERRYIMLRTQKGGGLRNIELLRSSSYEDILSIMKNKFFPNGKSPMGKMSKYNLKIGDFNGNPIPAADFDFPKLIGKYEKCVKLYLLTKEKTFSVETDESSDDFELPELNFTVRSRDVQASSSGTANNINVVAQGSNMSNEAGTPQQVQGERVQIPTGTPTVQFNIQQSVCEICHLNERSHFLIPCGHTFCFACASHLSPKLCAYCRQNFTKIQPLYG